MRHHQQNIETLPKKKGKGASFQWLCSFLFSRNFSQFSGGEEVFIRIPLVGFVSSNNMLIFPLSLRQICPNPEPQHSNHIIRVTNLTRSHCCPICVQHHEDVSSSTSKPRYLLLQNYYYYINKDPILEMLAHLKTWNYSRLPSCAIT